MAVSVGNIHSYGALGSISRAGITTRQRCAVVLAACLSPIGNRDTDAYCPAQGAIEAPHRTSGIGSNRASGVCSAGLPTERPCASETGRTQHSKGPTRVPAGTSSTGETIRPRYWRSPTHLPASAGYTEETNGPGRQRSAARLLSHTLRIGPSASTLYRGPATPASAVISAASGPIIPATSGFGQTCNTVCHDSAGGADGPAREASVPLAVRCHCTADHDDGKLWRDGGRACHHSVTWP